MRIQSPGSGRRQIACGAAILTALFGVVPFRAFADPPAATHPLSSIADVSLSDLNLSSPQGLRQAGDRLHAMAERVCAERGGGVQPSAQPGFSACVESTVASALRRIEALKQSHLTARNSVTVGEAVSLADLDLSTLEGAHLARQRLERMARRVCDELARRRDLPHQPDVAACQRDTLAGALAQADAIAAARKTQVVQRSAPP